MLIGYIRVSKTDGSQNLDLQIDAMKKEGISEERIYTDMVSAKSNDRVGLINCLKALQPGNTLVVWKLDRLCRNLKDLLNLIDDLKNRQINLKILNGAESQIDTNTSMGKMFLTVAGMFAEVEREYIRERTKAGLAAARARGRSPGRRHKITKETLQIIISTIKDRKSRIIDLAKLLNVDRKTIYNYVNIDGSLTERGKKINEM